MSRWRSKLRIRLQLQPLHLTPQKKWKKELKLIIKPKRLLPLRQCIPINSNPMIIRITPTSMTLRDPRNRRTTGQWKVMIKLKLGSAPRLNGKATPTGSHTRARNSLSDLLTCSKHLLVLISNLLKKKKSWLKLLRR